MSERASQGSSRTLAVVGAGPAGLYAARAAVASSRFAAIDVIEALPAPYGLVRYGVAPDHADTKRVVKVFDGVFGAGHVRFLGNVEVGRDIAHAELMRSYDAVIYATGVSGARRAPVPGAELSGSVSSAEFVSWYSGHPDAGTCGTLRSARTAVVIGGGNVALDVARLLVAPAEGLVRSDMPDAVLDQFRRSGVAEVHVLVRKGPAETRFSPVELRDLGELAGVVARVDGAHVEVPAEEASTPRSARENLAILRSWASSAGERPERTVHFHFWSAPTEIRGESAVRSVEAVVDAPGRTRAAISLRADLVVHCVGFSATGPDWLPVRRASGVVGNVRGRVQSGSGGTVPRVYVTGWLKRGPSGTIATNRGDAEETIASLLEDLDSLPRRGRGCDVLPLLLAAGVSVVQWPGWRAIRVAEELAGRDRGAASVKVSDRGQMLAIARRAERATA